jgi:membrane-associated phospholipid phosphatase
VAYLAHRWPRVARDPRPSEPVSRWARRLDPGAATGLALTLALATLVLGGIVLGVLALVLRRDPDAIGLDASAGNWGHAHATALTDDVIGALTHVGQPGTIVALAVVLAVVETVRTRSPWIAPFLLVVVAGNGFVTTTIKHVADRVRPEFNPVAETLGPSFPSGHSSWSAAFFAAAALVLARHRGRPVREALAGAAAAIAVAIAATRVLLGVHWLSDVVAGLALGWAWFAACAIAFGGRLLRFGATAEAARDAAPETARRAPVSARGR